MLTNQDIFNKVWDHFVVQRQPQSISGAFCRYRGPDGARCAIGIFLTDEEAKTCERYSISQVAASFPSIYSTHFQMEDKDFLTGLQLAHDNARRDCSFDIDIKMRLSKLADAYRLEIPHAH